MCHHYKPIGLLYRTKNWVSIWFVTNSNHQNWSCPLTLTITKKFRAFMRCFTSFGVGNNYFLHCFDEKRKKIDFLFFSTSETSEEIVGKWIFQIKISVLNVIFFTDVWENKRFSSGFSTSCRKKYSKPKIFFMCAY